MGILEGVAGAVTGGITSLVANKYLQDQQNKANVNLWREQVAYNEPSKQMERLRSAGLNPNLVYGSGSVANTAGAPPAMGRPNFEPGGLSDYATIENLEAQNANIHSQNRLLAAQAIKANADTDLVGQYKSESQAREAVSQATAERLQRENKLLGGDFPTLASDPAWVRLGARAVGGIKKSWPSIKSFSAQGLAYADRARKGLVQKAVEGIMSFKNRNARARLRRMK